MKPTFAIGDHDVWRIEEWGGKFAAPAELFAEYEEEAFSAQAERFTPDYLRDGELYAFLQSWLIDVDGTKVLIDTGAGNGKDRPHIPVFGNLETDFLEQFEQTGTSPQNVDIVINTHLHIDHVGWNTSWDNGQWRPTFPNARYIFPRIEKDVWDPEGDQFGSMNGRFVNANVFEDSVQPILESGRAELVEDGHEVLPGVRMLTAPGHTPGHMLVEVQSGNDMALFTGDILHHPMQIIRPDWNSVFCEDPMQAAETRRKVIERAARTGARLVPAHFGGSHSVFVSLTSDGFQPVKG
tara:strand:- start:8965 stop:9849 length:885 start_codon:yes stop_codon:yes gene_type:complete